MKKTVFLLSLLLVTLLGTSCRRTVPYANTATATSTSVENPQVRTFMERNNATFSENPSLYNSFECFAGVDTDQPDSSFVGRLRNRIPSAGEVRMIAINHGFNIRDLGGWKGWNGNRVRYGAIYRGGSLGGGVNFYGIRSKDFVGRYQIDESDRRELLRLGIRAQLDLRAAFRKGKYVDSTETSYHAYSSGEPVLGEGCDYCNIQTDYGAYVQDASLISDVAWIIYELKRGNPVYFNCRQGADRTGALAFVIEGLLGCWEYKTQGGGNQMAMDYEMTGFSRAGRSDNKGDAAYRPAQEAYRSHGKVFYKMINDVDGIGGGKETMQEKCYYFLNRFALDNPSYLGQQTAISSTDLDWFINYMLGITDIKGKTAKGKERFTGPSWAKDNADIVGYDLRNMAERNANTVSYAKSAESESGITDIRHIKISVRDMQPLRYSYRNVHGEGYELSLDEDTVCFYLPYMGDAYQADFNTDGLNMTKKVTDLTYARGKKGRIEIFFQCRRDMVLYQFRLTLFPNGTADIFLQPSNAQSISYTGEIEN